MSITSPDESIASELLHPVAVDAKSYKAFRRKFLTHRPGYLTTQGTLQIKTRMAQQHFLALLSFAKRVKKIYLAAQQDDPYADAALLTIEQTLEKAQIFFQKKWLFYQQHVSEPSGLSMPIMDTEKPLCVPVRFGVLYANMAARILADFDTLFRCVISLYQWGLLADQSLKNLLRELSEPLHALWKSTKNWQSTGLTRTAFIEPTALANEVIASLKPLDARVLNKEHRAKYAPHIFEAKPISRLIENGK